MIRSTFRKYIIEFIGDAGLNNLTNRQFWVQKALRNVPEGSRILDAGAGEQQYRQYCSHLNYVSQDFCEYDGDGNKKGLQTGAWDISQINIISDIIAIPEPNASFDAILCTEVLEHIPDPIAALREFQRLLRPGGSLILTAPFASLTHFAPYHFCTGFNKYFYENHLPKIGFSIEELSANGNYSSFISQELIRITTYFGKTPLYAKVCIAILLRFIN